MKDSMTNMTRSAMLLCSCAKHLLCSPSPCPDRLADITQWWSCNLLQLLSSMFLGYRHIIHKTRSCMLAWGLLPLVQSFKPDLPAAGINVCRSLKFESQARIFACHASRRAAVSDNKRLAPAEAPLRDAIGRKMHLRATVRTYRPCCSQIGGAPGLQPFWLLPLAP